MSKAQASFFMIWSQLFLIEQNVNPTVWFYGKTVGQVQNVVPVVIKLKDPHLFPHQKEYPLKPDVKEDLTPSTVNVKDQGLLIPCNSPSVQFSLVHFGRSVMSNFATHKELQHARPPCPSPTPGVYPNTCPLSR